MKNIVLSVLGVAILLAGAYFFLNNYLYRDKPQENIPQRIDLSGTYVCLPLKDESIQDPDCTVGIRTDDDTYYAIDLGLMSQGVPQLLENDRIQASGIVTPIETLSTDFWQKYPVVGIFSVTDSLEILKEEQAPLSHATSSLTDGAWIWRETVLQDGTKLTAPKDAFVLKFTPELSYESTTDCNSLSGKYIVDGEVLSLASPAMTKMFCEGSLEGEYVMQLLLVNSYTISSTTLTLHLNRDYGTMVLEAQ